MANVVQELQQKIYADRLQLLAYFYCDRNQAARQSPEAVARSFIRQLSTAWYDNQLLPKVIEDVYAKKEAAGFASNELTFEECQELFPHLLKGYQRVTFILDALDECNKPRDHLIKVIDTLLNSTNICTCKFFVSSRPDRDIKHRFSGGPNVNIRATDNQQDIFAFINETIENSPQHWQDFVNSKPGLSDEIVQTLQGKAEGM